MNFCREVYRSVRVRPYVPIKCEDGKRIVLVEKFIDLSLFVHIYISSKAADRKSLVKGPNIQPAVRYGDRVRIGFLFMYCGARQIPRSGLVPTSSTSLASMAVSHLRNPVSLHKEPYVGIDQLVRFFFWLC